VFGALSTICITLTAATPVTPTFQFGGDLATSAAAHDHRITKGSNQ
jgi:hypothetical protein